MSFLDGFFDIPIFNETLHEIKSKNLSTNFIRRRNLVHFCTWHCCWAAEYIYLRADFEIFERMFFVSIWGNSGFRGGGGGRGVDASPQGFDPLPTQRVPLCAILRYPYLLTDHTNVLRAPLAPVYTNFEGRGDFCVAKKTQFFGRNFPKSALKRLFWLFKKISQTTIMSNLY